MRNVALQLHTYIGSTYLYETTFSHIIVIKLECRDTLFDDPLEQSFRLTVKKLFFVINWPTIYNIAFPHQQYSMFYN